MSRTDRQQLARELDTQEALTLLASAPLGRVVFTANAMPAVCPAPHIVDEGVVVFGSHMGEAIVSHTATSNAVVAYQADNLDPMRPHGWTVTVTGIAHIVQDPELINRYKQRLRPWTERVRTYFISLNPTLVTGTRWAEKSPTHDGDSHSAEASCSSRDLVPDQRRAAEPTDAAR